MRWMSVLIVSIIVAGALLMAGIANAERVPVLDEDNDGMDDNWELANGLDPTVDDSLEDKDGDGVTNIKEYLDYSDPDDPEDSPTVISNRRLVFIGVAVAAGVSAIMSSLGIGIAGAAAAGVVGERPDKFGKLIIYQAMPMTQGIYGLLIAILVLNFTGLTDLNIEVLKNPFIGWAALGIGIVIALSSFSAIPQGMTSASAAAAFGRNNAIFGKGMIFIVMSETLAIFGLLVALFLILASGMLG
ncbi:MAG: hypothetical protein QCI82_01605 [Candidatus Thermoplasmatota archaeon]|nr:hypothetical protein [Candidatus Thermoplasmatota archaeon]